MKASTLSEDAKILSLVDAGWMPKAIKVELNLQNAMRVYNAIRRRKNNLQKIAKNKTG